jgi:hypothetical protein
MYTNKLARQTVVILGALCAPLLSANPASATAPAYAAGNATVWVTGSAATALNRCLYDARDGLITTAQSSCHQAAGGGNVLRLTNTSVWVFSRTAGRAPVYSRSHATITISGRTAIAINQRVNDAQDRVINNQTNACDQIATAGNVLRLSGVSIIVDR